MLKLSKCVQSCTDLLYVKVACHVIEWSPSPNSLEVEHQSCKLEVLSSILSLGFTFFIFSHVAANSGSIREKRNDKTSIRPREPTIVTSTAISSVKIRTWDEKRTSVLIATGSKEIYKCLTSDVWRLYAVLDSPNYISVSTSIRVHLRMQSQ